MVKVDLYVLAEKESLSGAKKSMWEKQDKPILVSIYQTGQFVSADKFRNTETTHQILTPYRGLVSRKNRVKNGNEYLEVLEVDNNHRLSVASAKEVKPW